MYTGDVAASSFPSGIRRSGEELIVERGRNIPDTVSIPWDSESSFSIRAEEGSRATVFLTLPSGADGEKSLDVTLAAASSLSLIVLASDLGKVKIRQRIAVGVHASCHLLNVTLGGKGVEQEVAAMVEGTGGASSVDWVFHAAGDDAQKLTARNVFRAREGGGEIAMRGVAEGSAAVRCDGMVEIGEGGGGTATYLRQDVLMLDATAKVDAVPGLEIKTNDVSASHSATVTNVSPEDLFYFASRGMPEAEARSLYIGGFLEDMLGKIEDEGVRRRIAGEIGR